MQYEIMKQILEKIKEYDKIIIFRHFRPDGDAIGSTMGLREILRASFPEKTVLVLNADMSDYLAFLGGEDAPIADEEYADALAIIVDTGTADRASNKKFTLCREVVKIDHHIDDKPYGDISWVEDFRSSSCEMIVKFYDTFRDELKMTKEAAHYLYCGMVTDSGRFRFRSVSGETLRLAGILLDVGVDIDTLYAQLYLKDFDSLKLESYVYEKMQMTESGVAYIYVDRAMQERFGLTQEEASAVVSHLENIRGSLIWIAFIDNKDGSIRVRLRSRFVTVNELASKYHGGGHDCASGATCYSQEEMQALIADAEALHAKYKSENEGWL
jgi:phosphoesterase RecJ-like protein